MNRSRRILILPIAAAVIAGLCAYKLMQPDSKENTERAGPQMRRAPLFELSNHKKPPRSVRLERYLGRHQIVLVFFDSEMGIAADAALTWLIDNSETLNDNNTKILAIGQDLPQVHRKLLAEIPGAESAPLQILSDLDGAVHRDYGVSAEKSQSAAKGVFVIDRAGNLPFEDGRPKPLEFPIEHLRDRLGVD